MKKTIIASLLLILTSSTFTSAAVVSFSTPIGADIQGELVNVTAEFTTGTDSVTIKATNLREDPNSPKQVLTGVFFTLSTGENSGSLDSISSQERTVNSDGSFEDGLAGGGTTGWALTTQGPQLLVDILNFPGMPERGIIGPPNSGTNTYDAGGGAIRNDPHNPFFNQMATFALTVPGVTDASTVTAATFQFNTTPGDNIVVPEPVGFGMSFAAALILCLGQRRKRGRV